MKLISVVTACFNEEDNVEPLHERIKAQFASMPRYRYEHIFIDNASTDRTVERIKAIAARDKNVKLIVNARNFGHLRSPMHGMMQARGDAVVSMASDLQDPPELIPRFVDRWESGYKIVAGVKPKSRESFLMRSLRGAFYRVLGRIAEIELIPHFTGFGLYDRQVMEIVRQIGDPYPYFRGIIAEIGFPHAEVPYEQPERRKGVTKNNFYSLYDLAMLGMTSHSKVPLRLAAMAGFALAFLSLAISLGYLVAKVLFWEQFSMGMAPVLIGLFFFAAVQLFFIGIVGEYVGAIHTQVLNRPLAVERERVNFEDADDAR
jgi:glycosyltransferase involved in cell wall biosynthesis